jgi:hypothetical protein
VPSFTVTAASLQVSLDAAGAGQAAFTVTNMSTQTLKGRLIPAALPPTEAGWLSVSGEPLREFQPGAAEQVTVQVKAPPGSPPGSYSFRLDAVSEMNPDEDFTQGPSVTFEVKPPPPKKPFPWWILIVVAVVLIGIGVLVWLLTKGDDDDGAATLPAPSLTAPLEGATSTPNVAIPVIWNPVEGATKYAVELERCEPAGCQDGATPVSTTETAMTVSQALLAEAGTGRVRVVAIAGDVRGSPSDWRSFTISANPSGPVVTTFCEPLPECLQLYVRAVPRAREEIERQLNEVGLRLPSPGG